MPLPVVVAELGDRPVARHPDDVDDSVEAAELLRDGFEERATLLAVRRVGLSRDSTDLRRNGFSAISVEIHAHNLRANAREGMRRLVADPHPSPEDDEDFSIEAEHVCVVRYLEVV